VSGVGLLLRCDGDAIDRSRLTQHDYQLASSPCHRCLRRALSSPPLLGSALHSSHGWRGSMHACPVRPCTGRGSWRAQIISPHGLCEWPAEALRTLCHVRGPGRASIHRILPELLRAFRRHVLPGHARRRRRKSSARAHAASVSATTLARRRTTTMPPFNSRACTVGEEGGYCSYYCRRNKRRPGSTGVNTRVMHLHVYLGRSSSSSRS
jgi:hypothetical protein